MGHAAKHIQAAISAPAPPPRPPPAPCLFFRLSAVSAAPGRRGRERVAGRGAGRGGAGGGRGEGRVKLWNWSADRRGGPVRGFIVPDRQVCSSVRVSSSTTGLDTNIAGRTGQVKLDTVGRKQTTFAAYTGRAELGVLVSCCQHYFVAEQIQR